MTNEVLPEFYVTVVRKIQVPLTPEAAMDWIEQLEVFPCLPVDSDLVKIAIEISERERISHWDGAIVAAAELLGAPTLYGEDLSHAKQYGAVRVCNPFRSRK